MTNDLHYCLFLHVLPFREHSRESLQQEIEKQESGGEMCQTGFVPIPSRPSTQTCSDVEIVIIRASRLLGKQERLKAFFV